MINCAICEFFNEEYNELRQAHNDIGNEEDTFCISYLEGIPVKIRENEKRCEYFVEKAEA